MSDYQAECFGKCMAELVEERRKVERLAKENAELRDKEDTAAKAYLWEREQKQIAQRECAELRKKLEWQPIVTAPKDGTTILVSNGVEVDTAYWDYDDWCAPHSSANHLPYEPTHWKYTKEPQT